MRSHSARAAGYSPLRALCIAHRGGCTVFEDPVNLHLLEKRWYSSSARIFYGSLLIIDDMHEDAAFYNIDPILSFEFFPPMDSAPRPSEFLKRSLPANLFPRYAPSFPFYRSKDTHDLLR